MTLKSVNIWSAARVFGALYAGMGLVFGGVVAIVSLLGFGLAQAAGEDAVPAAVGIFLGVGAIFLMPIFYGLLGALAGAFMAFLYNLISGVVGGLEIDLG